MEEERKRRIEEERKAFAEARKSMVSSCLLHKTTKKSNMAKKYNNILQTALGVSHNIIHTRW